MQYHKIRTFWKRAPEKPCPLIVGEFSLPEFEHLALCQWSGQEKLDGTNIRLIWDGNEVRFGGKTDRAQLPVPLLDVLTDR